MSPLDKLSPTPRQALVALLYQWVGRLAPAQGHTAGGLRGSCSSSLYSQANTVYFNDILAL